MAMGGGEVIVISPFSHRVAPAGRLTSFATIRHFHHSPSVITKTILALLVFSCLSAAALADSAWKEYVHPNYGYKVGYPATLVMDPMKAKDLNVFHTPKKDFRVVIAGNYLYHGDTLETMWQKDLKEHGKGMIHQTKTRHGFRYTEAGGGKEYRMHVEVKSGKWALLSVQFDQAKATQYDPWAAQVERSFVPFYRDYVGVQR